MAPLTLNQKKEKLTQIQQLENAVEQRQDQTLFDEANKNYIEKNTEVDHQDTIERLSETLMYTYQKDDELEQVCPEAVELMQTRMNTLQTDMNRSGMDKVKNDFTGSKKKEAKRKMLQINAKRDFAARYRQDPDTAARRRIYPSTEKKEKDLGREWRLGCVFNYFALGSHGNRHDKFTDPEKNLFTPTITFPKSIVSPVTITTGKGELKGHKYVPKNEEMPPELQMDENQRKVVIFFSGSHGSNASMIEDVAKAYNHKGAVVLGVDYRGFGESISKNKKGQKTGTSLIESSIYKDGRDIYNYVIEKLGKSPSDVILHGFSLGGAVASKLAADLAQENAEKIGRGETVEENDRIGGLVMHSSIESVIGTAGKIQGGIGGSGTGHYNATTHMKRLASYDPHTPVHFRGGNQQDDVQSLHNSKLHEIPGFLNTSHHHGTKGHQEDGIIRRWGVASNFKDTSKDNDWSNKDDGMDFIEKMIQHGRNANLGGT
jgi:pimeloyl-ACP methyl ester carboxylesterase